MDNSEFLEKASKGTLSFRYNQFPTTTLVKVVACGFVEVISLLENIQNRLYTMNNNSTSCGYSRDRDDNTRYGGPTW